MAYQFPLNTTKTQIRAGNMAQKLRALATLSEDQEPIPSSQTAAQNQL